MTHLLWPRLPANYQLLLEIVEAGGRGLHRSTAEIYDEARRQRPGIGYSTVQRGLARLGELGLIMPVRLPNHDAILYEPAGSRHAHFACDRCGRTLDIAFTLPQTSLDTLARQHGVVISAETIAFRGLCSRCSA